jgi:hypothetical protein
VARVRNLGQPNAAFADDHGAPDPQVRAALAAAHAGDTAYARAIAELCTARLLLPIVAEGDETSAVLLESASGGKAVLVFTGLDTLAAWRPDARPVPCTLDDVAATVLEVHGAAIVIDVEGPFPLVIEGPLVDELARGRRLVELPDGGFGWMFLDRAGG